MIKFIQNKYIIFVLFALVSDAYMSKITPSVDVSQIDLSKLQAPFRLALVSFNYFDNQL